MLAWPLRRLLRADCLPPPGAREWPPPIPRLSGRDRVESWRYLMVKGMVAPRSGTAAVPSTAFIRFGSGRSHRHLSGQRRASKVASIRSNLYLLSFRLSRPQILKGIWERKNVFGGRLRPLRQSYIHFREIKSSDRAALPDA